MEPTIKATPNPVSRGNDLTIKLRDSQPNSSVVLTISCGDDPTVEVVVETDELGDGVAYWTVPDDWGDVAEINGGGAQQETVAVTSR